MSGFWQQSSNSAACWVITAILALVPFGSSLGATSGSPGPLTRFVHHEGRTATRVVQWVVRGEPSENSVRIGNTFGWCPGLGQKVAPRITGVRQVGRPHSVVLTAYLSSGSTAHCAGVEASVERQVRIRGGLDGRALLDGSQSPPITRWPRR